uniref:DNA polymerase epsilon subunit D n=1 Tax=Lygus hesperus TaxID=30085 RepID=A0A0A9YBJ8_LYGHE
MKQSLVYAASVFVLYLGTVAEEVCTRNKRKIVTPQDVVSAVELLPFKQKYIFQPLVQFMNEKRLESVATVDDTSSDENQEVVGEVDGTDNNANAADTAGNDVVDLGMEGSTSE